MKKRLLFSLVGWMPVAAAISAHAQGRIWLYNYNPAGVPNPIVYGNASGGPLGAGITGPGWTVGMFYALGDFVAQVNAQWNPNWNADIPGWGILQVATGAGATTPLGDYQPGQYSALEAWAVPGSGAVSQPVTIVVMAHNGADYFSALRRGHSRAFLMNTAVGLDFAPLTGTYMEGFVIQLPEPSAAVLLGLGLAGLVLMKRGRRAAREASVGGYGEGVTGGPQ